MRKALPGTPPLREEGAGLLRNPLPPAVWQFVLRLQPGHRRRW